MRKCWDSGIENNFGLDIIENKQDTFASTVNENCDDQTSALNSHANAVLKTK
jgi:hypothetical protein